MKSWEDWNLLISLDFKQLQHPHKNNWQKAVEKGVRIKTLRLSNLYSQTQMHISKHPLICILYIYAMRKLLHFKTCHIITVTLSTKCHSLHNFTFRSNNTFFINHAPKFIYKSSCLKVKVCDNQNRTVQAGTVGHKMARKELPIN